MISKKYSHIDFRPPADVARAAAKGLALRDKFNRGGTAVGIARGRDLKNRKQLSPSTVRRMASFFARHAVDKRAPGFGNDTKPSNGWIAWLLWGGDPGRKWADAVKHRMAVADKEQ